MVIQESSNIPFKVPNPMDSKKYIVVKNHVRELSPERQNSKNNSSNAIVEKSIKCTKKRKKTLDQSENVSEMFTEDIEELKTVYHKCKTILAKIEAKYGHLLNLDYEENQSNKKLKLNQEDIECNCILNKKIVFDDDGKLHESIQNYLPTTHVCLKRLQHKEHHQTYQQTVNVTVEEDNFNSDSLPNNLIELCEILKKSDISSSFRHHVIKKLKFIKQVNSDMIRCNKLDLINKLKSDPNEVISFKGSNLSTLKGYPEPKS